MKKQHKHLFSFQTLFLSSLFVCLCLTTSTAQQTGTLEALSTAGTRSSITSVHQVQRGETLYSISRKYGMTVAQIQRLNGMPNTLIKSGQTLLIQTAENTRAVSNVNNVLARQNVGTTRGPIQAQTRASSVLPPQDQIDAELDILANTRATYPPPIASAGRLAPVGSVSALPKKLKVEKKAYYQVQAGDDIYSIADAYEVSADELRDWNAVTTISPGQVIVVDKWYEEIDRTEASALVSTTPGTDEPEALISTPQEARTMRLKRAESAGISFSETPTILGRLDQVSRGVQQTSNTIYQAANWSEGLKAESGPYLEYANADVRDLRFYAVHPTLPVGSRVKMHLPDNPGYVELIIVGRLQGGTNAVIGLSSDAAAILKAANHRTVTIRY